MLKEFGIYRVNISGYDTAVKDFFGDQTKVKFVLKSKM